MKDLTRRRLIGTGLTAAIGAIVGRSVFHIASHNGLIPPDHGGIFGIGETLTYAAQRVLAGDVSLGREFSRSDISKVIPVNGPPPETERFIGLLDGEFRNWRLRVDGLVARRTSFSLADLKSLPAHTQITHQACEEGWSFIAEWTGVRLSHVLELVGVDPRARYVVFFSFDDFWESIDMADALHPQTFLAYAMNGPDMPLEHGAPLRLRVARQLGYKSVKYLGRMIVTDSIAGFGKGLGGINAEYGYSWWAGI